MARGIIGKMIRGAAEAGVPMLQEEHRAQIQTRRDEALNRISQQNRREDQTFQREMNTDNQKFEAGQRDMDRSARAEEFSANQADAAEERGMQREELGLKRQESELARQQLLQALEIGSFGIVEQNRLKGLQDILDNPQSTPEQISSAVQRAQNTVSRLLKEDPDKYQALTLYGPENENGDQTRASGILNNNTGVVTPVSPASGGGGSNAFDELPNPSSYNGRTVEDDVTGKRYRSNGSEWVEI